jgi:hypothetical protein
VLELSWKEVKRFHDAAWKNHEAAASLLAICSPNASSNQAAATIYLGGYAVECILKALVLSKVRPKRHKRLLSELKKEVGHDLEKLRQRLEKGKKATPLPLAQARQLRFIRARWSSEMRYDPQKKPTDEARQFLASAEALLNWACGR